MATTNKSETAPRDAVKDIERDIQALREDIANLASQLAAAGKEQAQAAKGAAYAKAEELRRRGEDAVERARANAEDVEAQIIDHVHEKPITSLAIAAGVGFLTALILRR
ncbi:DUF883 family protein [Limoniibacter endophyticus]|uniref:ElaB/YqjD/DUF883 family membrane-anchored ribosome-binding protein n=1 Tax=Limoniibacter endophyticus TaxID=1565040 RepID=A0A8J3DK64_9HYPH|nr:DUF883 family protein [Limoniibacter endophyticus]GHC76583.1 hypothetical protein GCM10010136_27390 [Limoniibacter endophyticus]